MTTHDSADSTRQQRANQQREFRPDEDTPFNYGSLETETGYDYWALDPVFRAEAERLYGNEDLEYAKERLEAMGRAVGETIMENADIVDQNGPELHTYDKHGNVVNEVEYHPAHIENERLAFEHGAVADSFRAPPGRDDPLPLVHSLAMYYLLSYADGGLVCSVSMTGGVAVVLENNDDDQLDEFYNGLIQRDYESVIQGAMFMTEKQGGSDVGANETVAEATDEEDVYELSGEKWFCSNIDAGAALVLARRPDAPGGTEGLSLFLLPRTKRDGEPNDFYYRRLKDKLGTISVPTGEVELREAEAYLVGDPEEGFAQMTEMLSYERITNAVGSVAGMGHLLLESKIHAANREAFGQPIGEFPLMQADLVEMAVDHEAATAFAFEAARCLDAYRENDNEETFRSMRILAPVAKYRTARMSVDTASYAMEIKGGNGYVRGFGTHRALRDAQVGPIWEGTSNIQSLDVLRAMNTENAHEPVLETIDENLSSAAHPHLEQLDDEVRDEFNGLKKSLGTVATEGIDYAQLNAKRIADYIFDVYAAALLIRLAQEQIDEAGNARKAVVAKQFVDMYLRQHDERGITSGETLSLDYYDAIVRFERVSADAL